MKHLIMSLIFASLGLFSGTVKAFLCEWKDLACISYWVLPYGQATIPPNTYNEWAPVSGEVTGSGSRIEIVFRLNSQSVSTLSYQPNWYSAQNIVFRKFGLEVDIAEAGDGNTLRFDRIEWENIPSNAGPTKDTEVLDSINKSKNAIGLLIRDAGYLQTGVDYKVYVYLKDPLPENGVAITPYFQISADTRLLGYAQSAAQGDYLFNAAVLGGFTDKFDYFAVEGRSYVTGWKLYRDGRQGMRWTGKGNGDSQIWNSPVSPSPGPGATSASSDPGDRMLAVTTLPTAADPPATQADFIVDKFWIENSLGNKVKVLYPGEPITTKGKVKNRGSANSPSAITVKYYLSSGRKVDSNKVQVGTDTIQAYNLPSGGTHTESVSLTAPTTPGIYNYTFCADTGSVVSEKHESNNCSDELVIEVVRRSPAEVKRFVNGAMSVIND